MHREGEGAEEKSRTKSSAQTQKTKAVGMKDKRKGGNGKEAWT